MAGKRAVVFGGTGFLGRRVVAVLAESGHDARAAARHPGGAGPGGHIVADVTDPASVELALAGAEAVVNCVGLYAEAGEATFKSVHVEGARNLAEAAAKAGVEALVHISGIGVDAASPSAYVRARAEGEAAVSAAFPQATILRPSVMFGPGDAFLSTLAGITAMAPVIPLFGSGGTRLQPVHVDDVAGAVRAAIADPATRGAVFELGGPEVLTYRAIVERVLGWTGRRRLLVPFPFAGWEAMAATARLLPNPPITEGQIALMKRDNTVGEGAKSFADLGIEPQPMGDMAPAYLA